VLHLKFIEKQGQAKPKSSWKREIVKMRTEIFETDTKKPIERIN
jgi:hypothetical protein